MDILDINRAFSKQSAHYDVDDHQNKILQDMRHQVYAHVSKYLKPQSKILELNAGTGIDALHFVDQGHSVLATDLSDGMVEIIKKKILDFNQQELLSCQQLSYDHLDRLKGKQFDYVFSNFGGLNCIDDLSKVTRNLPAILHSGSYVTWVIMPPVCLWEMMWFFKGHPKAAFRRFHEQGIMAHLEGEYFRTWYHSLSDIKKAFGPAFEFIAAEGLCTLSPPPSSEQFPTTYPGFYKRLRLLDSKVRNYFPFNRWGDHLIVTMKKC